MKLLEAKDISHSFDYELFSNVSISLDVGESISILGASGSGKTTLLSILSSMLKPKHGSVFIDGNDVYGGNSKRLTKVRREDVGIIFQSHYLFRGFSTLENLEISSYISGKKIDHDMLKRLQIDHVLNQKISTLSGGQRQRVSIARVLLKKPKVIFADEPTGNLDFHRAYDVVDILTDYAKGSNRGLILITHDEEVAKRCDRTYILNDSRLKEYAFS